MKGYCTNSSQLALLQVLQEISALMSEVAVQMNPSNQDQRGMPAGSGIQPLVFSGDETQVASRKGNTTWGLGILELSDTSKRENVLQWVRATVFIQ